MQEWKQAAEALSHQVSTLIEVCQKIEAEIHITGVEDTFRNQFFDDLCRLAVFCTCVDGFRHEKEDQLFLQQMVLLEKDPGMQKEILERYHQELARWSREKPKIESLHFPSVGIAHTLGQITSRQLAEGLAHQLLLFASNITHADGIQTSHEDEILLTIQGNLMLALSMNWASYKKELELRSQSTISNDPFADLIPLNFVIDSKGNQSGKEKIKPSLLDAVVKDLESFIGCQDFVDHGRHLVEQCAQNEIKEMFPEGIRLAFTGPSGSGKSVAAQIMARLYHQLGFISSSRLKISRKNEWIEAYVKQKQGDLNDLFESSRDSVLLIENAQDLDSGSEIGPDLRSEFLEIFERKAKEYGSELIIILSFDQEVPKSLNSLIEGTFSSVIHFNDLSDSKMGALLSKFAKDQGFEIEISSGEIVNFINAGREKFPEYVNAHLVNHLLKLATTCQFQRINNESEKENNYRCLKPEDFHSALS